MVQDLGEHLHLPEAGPTSKGSNPAAQRHFNVRAGKTGLRAGPATLWDLTPDGLRQPEKSGTLVPVPPPHAKPYFRADLLEARRHLVLGTGDAGAAVDEGEATGGSATPAWWAENAGVMGVPELCEECESGGIRSHMPDTDFPGGSDVKRLSTMREPRVQSLGREDPLEGSTANHCSILAWRIP